jgi:hypothetical protein
VGDIVTVSIADRSKYLRGLLVVIRKDNLIDPREKELVLQLGKILDFDPRFCEAAIEDLLRNPHITDEPVKFEDRKIARSFLRDGVRLALVDEGGDHPELRWLRAVAHANGLEEHATDTEIHRWQKEKPPTGRSPQFAISRHLS